jgi:hypothetical protein
MATTVKRNRSLVSDTAWILDVAHELEGRLELSAYEARDLKTNKPIRRVRAVLIPESGAVLSGNGKTATEAVHHLVQRIESFVESGR